MAATASLPLLLAVVLPIAAAAALGYEAVLDSRTLDEAIAIGQSRVESVRARFQQAYRTQVNQPPVDYIEIITPFRRVELASEEARTSVRRFGQREARTLLAAARGDVELVVEFTFHPHNTYLGVPSYDVALEAVAAATPPVRPRSVDRSPRHGARVQGLPSPYPAPPVPGVPLGSGPLLGGTVTAAFDGGLLDPEGTYDVVVSDAGRLVARARVSFARLR